MRIIFSRSLYNLKAIKSAIKEFKYLADFSVSEKKNEIAVELKNISKDAKGGIRDEFCNYVLHLMK